MQMEGKAVEQDISQIVFVSLSNKVHASCVNWVGTASDQGSCSTSAFLKSFFTLAMLALYNLYGNHTDVKPSTNKKKRLIEKIYGQSQNYSNTKLFMLSYVVKYLNQFFSSSFLAHSDASNQARENFHCQDSDTLSLPLHKKDLSQR